MNEQTKPEDRSFAVTLTARLGMEDAMILNFGKHKGRDIRDVMEIDPSYIAWAVSVGAVSVDKKMLAKAHQAHYEEQCYAEAVLESKHGDWGDRD